MRNKIQNSFHELPITAHEGLRDSLLSHIQQITNDTAPVIVTQLCLAISDLALLMSSWKDPVLSIIEKLSKKSDSIWPLLEILTLIPEEVDSRHLRLGANRREEIHKQLKTNSNTVMEFLIVCLTTYLQNQLILNKIIRCFNAWISINAISLNNFTENPIAQQVFRLLSSPDTSDKLHDSATDCLCTLLQCLEASNNNSYNNRSNNIGNLSSNNNHHHQQHEQQLHHDQFSSYNNEHQMLEMQIFNGILALENCYHTSVAHEDMEKAINYCRIFTSLGKK